MTTVSAITSVIVGTPTLPERFISNEFDGFLFFDFFLREASSFVEILQREVGDNSGIDIYSADTLEHLVSVESNEKWDSALDNLNSMLANAGNAAGIIMLAKDQRWVIAQDIPVNLGVVAYKKNDIEMDNFLKSLGGEWLISFDDFFDAEKNRESELNDIFDFDFIRKIVENYR